MAIQLETQTLYEGQIGRVAFGNVPADVLLRTVASGRVASLLLEQEISGVFGMEAGTQGASPDHIDRRLGRIQSKTYHSSGFEKFMRGPYAGTFKAARADIWTTKSGFWDRRNKMTEEDYAEADRYFSNYEHFMYVDISRMRHLRYSLVVVPSSQVADAKDGLEIAETEILRSVTKRVALDPAGVPLAEETFTAGALLARLLHPDVGQSSPGPVYGSVAG